MLEYETPNIPHARCTHSEVELRKCCLGQSANSKIPYHLINSFNVITSTPRLVVIATDCIGSYKSKYHTIMTTTALHVERNCETFANCKMATKANYFFTLY